MGSVDDCYDNAASEAFHASSKKERIYLRSWPTPGRGQGRGVRVHQGLVQPPAPALHPRLPLPSRVRTPPRARRQPRLNRRRRHRRQRLDLFRERARRSNRSRSGRDERESRDERNSVAPQPPPTRSQPPLPEATSATQPRTLSCASARKDAMPHSCESRSPAHGRKAGVDQGGPQSGASPSTHQAPQDHPVPTPRLSFGTAPRPAGARAERSPSRRGPLRRRGVALTRRLGRVAGRDRRRRVRHHRLCPIPAACLGGFALDAVAALHRRRRRCHPRRVTALALVAEGYPGSRRSGSR